MHDMNEIIDRVANAMRSYVGKAVKKFSDRLDEIEKRQAVPGPAGKDGRDGESITGPKGDPGESIVGPKGEKGDPGESVVGPNGETAYQLASKQGFAGSEGEWLESLKGLDGRDGESIVGPKGDRGDDGTPGDSAYQLAAKHGFVGSETQWIESLKAIDGNDGESIIGPKGDPGDRGDDGTPGDSAYQLATKQGFVGSETDWIQSLKGIGVHGKDGKDGVDGKDGDRGRDAIEIDVLAGVDPEKTYLRGTFAAHRGGVIRAFRHTDPITDSLEAAGWHVVMQGIAEFDMTMAEDDRTITSSSVLTSGKTIVKELHTHVQIFRGVWTAERAYERGDTVTHDGSNWHCERASDDKPGTSHNWKLMTKRGRDGKDGKDGDRGERGPEGRAGKDLTHMTLDGFKY